MKFYPLQIGKISSNLDSLMVIKERQEKWMIQCFLNS